MLKGPRPRGLATSLLLLLLGFAATFGAAFAWQGPGLAPVLWLAPSWSSVATLLFGFRHGHIAFAWTVALLIAYYASHPLTGPADLALRSNLATVTCVIHLFLVGYDRIFRWLSERLKADKERIEGRLRERSELTETLEHAVQRTVRSMEVVLDAPAPSLGQLHEDYAELERILARARETLHRDRNEATTRPEVVPDFAKRMTRWLIWISFGHTVLIAIRVGVLGRGAVTPTLLVMTCTLLAAALMKLRPNDYAPIVLGVALVTTLSVVSAFDYWGFTAPQPNLVLLPSLPYPAVLVGRTWVEVAFALALLAISAYVGIRARGAFDGWEWFVLSEVAIATLVMQATWHVIERRMRAKLRVLERHGQQLADLERFRMRVSGTLFHDVANLVQALGIILNNCEHAGKIAPNNLRMLRDLQRRLLDLVRAVLDVLSRSESSPCDNLVATSVPSTLRALEELFAHRLSSKSQILSVHSADVRVMAAPELLRDSVLANLISNAIKFSPEGATIELEARQSGDEVEIVVRDEGPGFPARLAEQLANKERVFSTRGSANEQGLGLGLTLASEHLQRMGGCLILNRRKAGGGEARVRLQSI